MCWVRLLSSCEIVGWVIRVIYHTGCLQVSGGLYAMIFVGYDVGCKLGGLLTCTALMYIFKGKFH